MKAKKVIAVIAVFAMILPCFSNLVYAENTKILLQDTFDGYVSNHFPDNYPLSAAGTARIVDLNDHNKAMYLFGETELTMQGEAYNDAEVSFDLYLKSDSVSNASIGVYDSTSKKNVYLFSIKKNILTTNEGSEFGNVPKIKFIKLTVTVNKNRNIYFVYSDDKLILKDWKLPSAIGGFGGLALKIGDSSSKLYIDKLSMYTGEIEENIRYASDYNAAKDSYIYWPDDLGDYSYFNSNYRCHSSGNSSSYLGTTLVPKTNKIEAVPLTEALNPDPAAHTGVIKFIKTTTDDVFIDVGTASARRPYYEYGFTFSVDNAGIYSHLCQMRDSLSSTTTADAQLLNISGGSLVLPNGGSLGKVKVGEIYTVKIVIDIKKHIADYYVDGNLKAENVSFSSAVNYPTLFRMAIDKGENGTLTVKDWSILGTQKPYTGDDSNRTSRFNEDYSSIYEFLSDKIAFHTQSGAVYAGEKIEFENSVSYYDEELGEAFFDIEQISRAYGIALEADDTGVRVNGVAYEMNISVSEDGRAMVPVKEFAKKVLGHFVFDDGNGLIITSENEFSLLQKSFTELFAGDVNTNYNFSVAEILNSYMLYERPSVQELKAAFEKTDKSHPRVMATKEDFDNIKEAMKTDAVLNDWVTRIIAQADAYLEKYIPFYNISDGLRLTSVCSEVRQRMESLGLAYQITGDAKYAQNGYKVLEAACNFPNWNPAHIIDLGEMNVAFAIGYDWLYDGFTEEQRKTIYEGVKKHGLLNIRDAYYGRLTRPDNGNCGGAFVKWRSNYNAVVNGGTLAAAVAFAEQDPDLCFDIAQKAMRSLEWTMQGFVPDGGWVESVGYWNYTLRTMVPGIEAVRKTFGTDYNLTNNKGMDHTGMYYISLDGPQGANNFGDMSEGRMYSTYLGWVGERYGYEAYSKIVEGYITKGYREPTVYDVIWHESDAQIQADDLPLDWLTKGYDSFTMRETNDEDADAMYFSTHGGPVHGYHAHADTGSFVFDINGHRWAADLGLENYNVANASGVAYYTAYRKRAEAHNVMVFDPNTDPNYGGQVKDGYAEVESYLTKDKGGYIIYDMQKVYSDSCKTNRRGFYVGDDRRSMTVRDEFETYKDVPAYWFMTTPSEVEIIDDNMAILTQGTDKLLVEIESNLADGVLEVSECTPLLGAPVLANQTSNAGYKRLIYHGTSRSGECGYITAKLSAVGEAAANTGIYNYPLSEWSVPDGECKKRERLGIKQIYVNGKPIEQRQISPGVVKAIKGEPMPIITAEAEDPEKTVEIIHAENTDDVTKLRVYASNGLYREMTISYKEIELWEDIDSFERYSFDSIDVSATPEAANHKENMRDEQIETRWTCMDIDGWAIFDLGEKKPLDAVALSFWKGNERIYSYEIYASSDGSNWELILSGKSGGETEGYEISMLEEPVTARYIKYVNKGNTNNDNCNIQEFGALKLK